MKKIKLYFIIALVSSSFLLFNCSNDNELGGGNNVETVKNDQQNLKIIEGNDFIIVDEDETPIFSKEDLSLLGFSDFRINKEEKTIINLKTNVVSLPYDPNLSIYKNPNNLMKANLVGIKIAKKNVKPGSGCSSCVDCIGFRCGFSRINLISEMEWSLKMETSVYSDSREQEAYVTVDTKNNTINLNFYNNIDWNNLK